MSPPDPPCGAVFWKGTCRLRAPPRLRLWPERLLMKDEVIGPFGDAPFVHSCEDYCLLLSCRSMRSRAAGFGTVRLPHRQEGE